MAWTYSGNPGHSNRDQVRFLIGDTNQNDQLLQDGEIDWLISQYNSPMATAIRACETVMAKFGRMADESAGPLKINFSQKVQGMQTILATLRNRIALEDCAPYAGGISVADKLVNESNTDRVSPAFTKDMMENKDIAPWTTEMENDETDPK